MNENEKELSEHLVFIKQNIVNLRDQGIYPKIYEHFERKSFLRSISVLLANHLIVEDESIYLITEKGERYLEQVIKELEYNSEKERIEFEKSKIDLDLAQKMLKEYPYTKWFARISFLIAIVLAVLEIIRWKDK